MKPTEDYLKEFVTIFFAQKRIVVQTTLIIFVSAVLVAFFWPPTYAVRGSILVKNRQLSKSPEAIEQTETRVWEVDPETLNSEMRLIASAEVIGKALQALHDQGKWLPKVKNLANDRVLETVSKIKTNIKTEIVPGSTIIQITLFGKEAKEAKVFLDAIIDQYISYRAGIYYPEKAEGFFQDHADKFMKDILGKNGKLIDLAEKRRTADPEKEIQFNIELIASLQKELELAILQKNEKKLTIKYLENSLRAPGIQFFSSIVNQPINLLSSKLQDLFVERGNLYRIYTKDSVRIVRIDEQIDNTYKALKAEVISFLNSERQKLVIFDQQIEILKNRLDELSRRNLDLYAGFIEQKTINSEALVLEQSFQIFAKRSNEARISTSPNADSLFAISILSRPEVPAKPYFPDKQKVIPLGLIAGLILGCSLGYVVEYFDHTFKTQQDAPRYAGVPALFSIPDYSVK
ncbi:MAG: hypothetical protein V1816_01320 [Pseudomonadota bacterium]